MLEVITDARTGQTTTREIPQAEADAMAAASKASWRRQAACSRLQGRIALGAAVCAQLDALAADSATPFAMREALLCAGEWRRNSPTIDEMAWLLGLTAEQVDALFEQAATITV